MRELWLYDWMARRFGLPYRAKIMVMAFIGTHIPLIALSIWLALRASADWRSFVAVVGVTLLATLVGTAITLFVLNHLLRPVALTAATLRGYRRSRDTGHLPTHYTDEVGTLMSDTAETLTHLETALDRLEHLDTSTGLPNRRKLVVDLGRHIAAQGRFAACAIAMGNYDRIVAAFDLGTAEAAAGVVAQRLAGVLRPDETLYRISGAAFMFIARDAPEALPARLQAVLAAGAGGLACGGVTLDPILHAAVALCPDDAGGADQLIDHAIAAVALASDEMPVSFHSSATRRAAVERLTLEQDLRRALAQDEFVLHFQPVVDVARGHAIGAEALIRWQHPQRGLVQPGRFIAAAEASGLIDPIGLWVMRAACRQIQAWNGSGLPGMKVAINLSARQFLDRGLVGFVDEALRGSAIAADQLEIELTESAAMADHEHTRAVFGRLRDRGVSIAIDDFGTGYASMSYLRKLPFDKLKIDREFVIDVHKTRDRQAICGALITLARGLGLRVLAEGTETEDEVRHLRTHGCDLFQGFYFSKPLPANDFQRALGDIGSSARAIGKAAAAAPVAGFALAG